MPWLLGIFIHLPLDTYTGLQSMMDLLACNYDTHGIGLQVAVGSTVSELATISIIKAKKPRLTELNMIFSCDKVECRLREGYNVM